MNPHDSATPTTIEILVFEVAGRRFGILGAHVREVVRAVALHSVGDSAGRIDGMLNLRGQVVPVFNLRAWFDLPAKAIAPTDLLIVCQAGNNLLALRVDGEADLQIVATSDLEPPPAVMPTAGIVEVVAKSAEGLVLLLDPARIHSTAGPAGSEVIRAAEV